MLQAKHLNKYEGLDLDFTCWERPSLNRFAKWGSWSATIWANVSVRSFPWLQLMTEFANWLKGTSLKWAMHATYTHQLSGGFASQAL